MTNLPRTRDRSRDFDIVLWGATGFTGRLVADYLVRNYLGGDTGLIHLAVAMRRRVVALMWSKAPDQPIPYLRPEWVITPASGGRLDSIGEREVSEHVAGALGARHDS